MARQKQARSRREARRERLRERSTVLAAGLSALATVFAGVVVFGLLASIPGTALRNLCLLVIVNGQVNTGSELYRSLYAQIERQEVLFVTPACLLIGGLVLGRLTPRRIPRPRLLRAAAVVTMGVLLTCVLVRWGFVIWGQGGHLQAGELDARMDLTQIACSCGWVVAYLVGAGAGVRWRDSGHREEGSPSGTESYSLSR